jgi:hypothetical protein
MSVDKVSDILEVSCFERELPFGKTLVKGGVARTLQSGSKRLRHQSIFPGAADPCGCRAGL